MAEYISREAVLENVCVYCCENGGCRVECAEYLAMKAIPAADVAPVVHAHWTNKERCHGTIWGHCSNCGVSSLADAYCSNCGAKMDERSEDNV